VRAEGRFRVATIHFRLGELPKAEQNYGQALSLYKQLATEFPSEREFRLKLAKSHSNRGIVRRLLGRPTEAEQDDDQAVTLAKQLAADFSSQPEFRQELASNLNNRAILLRATGRLPEAEKDWNEAVDIYRQLAADFPSRVEVPAAVGRKPQQPGRSAEDRRSTQGRRSRTTTKP
jgi:tetratricopeptide (TPR) repeat protein